MSRFIFDISCEFVGNAGRRPVYHWGEGGAIGLNGLPGLTQGKMGLETFGSHEVRCDPMANAIHRTGLQTWNPVMDSATIDAITGLLNALGAIITALTGLFRPLALV